MDNFCHKLRAEADGHNTISTKKVKQKRKKNSKICGDSSSESDSEVDLPTKKPELAATPTKKPWEVLPVGGKFQTLRNRHFVL